MRNRRHVLDRGDLESRRLQRADGRLTAGPRPLHPHLDALHPGVQRLARRRLGRDLRRERRALARALEADLARAGPREHVAVRVRDRADGVVEAGVDVRDAIRADALVPFPRFLDFWHSVPPSRPSRPPVDVGVFPYDFFGPPGAGFAAAGLRAAIVFFGPLRVRAFVLVRWPRTGSPRRCRSPRYAPMSIRRLMFIATSLRSAPSTLYS